MNITIYSTTSCSTCHILTEWLDKQAVPYTKRVTDEDPAAMEEFMAVNDGLIGVPFTVIDTDAGERIKFSGYDISQLKNVLNIT